MKVPERFELYGTTFKVRDRAPSHFSTRNTYGHYIYEDGVIEINSQIPDRIRLQTFFHEFFHCALEELGFHNESAREDMVDGLAQLTVQMLRTAR